MTLVLEKIKTGTAAPETFKAEHYTLLNRV